MMFIKNSLARKALELRQESNNDQKHVVGKHYKGKLPNKQGWEKLRDQFKSVNGCIFSNGNLGKVAELIEEHTLSSNGYNGLVAEIDVIVPAGPTNIDIKMTNFFQKQNIPTKVQNKKITIEKDVTLLAPGDIVNGTHLKIIELLEMTPFKFKVQIKGVWDKGNIFGREVVYAKDEKTLEAFSKGVNHLTALALQTGLPVESSVQHSVTRLLKGLANMAFKSEADVKEVNDLVAFLKDPSKLTAQAVVVVSGGAKQEAKKEEKKAEEEVADVDLGGGLFGGDDEEW